MEIIFTRLTGITTNLYHLLPPVKNVGITCYSCYSCYEFITNSHCQSKFKVIAPFTLQETLVHQPSFYFTLAGNIHTPQTETVFPRTVVLTKRSTGGNINGLGEEKFFTTFATTLFSFCALWG